LTVIRQGAEMEIPVVLQETPASAADVETYKETFMEFSVREITFMDRVKNKWGDDMRGVIVGDVTSGGWANLAGLRGKDLLISLQDENVSDVKSFKEVMKKICEKKPRFVKFFVRRGFKTAFLFAEPDWSKYEEEKE